MKAITIKKTESKKTYQKKLQKIMAPGLDAKKHSGNLNILEDSLVIQKRQKKINQQLVRSLSKHLFWDVDLSTIDDQKHAKHIIEKVLKFGLYSDWKTITDYYHLDDIVEYAVNLRGLDKRTASFLSILSGVQKRNFSCYITEQSTPKHWNF